MQAPWAPDAPGILKILVEVPEIHVAVERKTIEVDLSSARGQVALLVSEGFFDQPKKSGEAWKEMKRRWNYGGISARAHEQLQALNTMGFVTQEADGFQAVPDMKRNIRT